MSALRIIGLDPGMVVTGYGVLETQGREVVVVDYGTIAPPTKAALPQRLQALYLEMQQLLQRIRPAAIAVEDTFHHRNFKSALTLGQARGVILLAGAQMGIPCHSFAPRKVKQSVVGNGNASKQQVQYMVKAILNLKDLPTPLDASDALAVGLCYLNQLKGTLRV